VAYRRAVAPPAAQSRRRHLPVVRRGRAPAASATARRRAASRGWTPDPGSPWRARARRPGPPAGSADFPVSTAHWPVESLRSEEHTSELQSRENLVCRLLLEKKKIHRERLTRDE